MEANAPTLRADINQLKIVQRLATRIEKGLRHVLYNERLRQLNPFSLERRRLRADLILDFRIQVDLSPSDFFLRPPRAWLRGHTYQLLQGPSRLRRRRGTFSGHVVKYWNRLPAPLALSSSVSFFKKQLGRQWSEKFPFPFIAIFFYTVTPDYLCFPYTQILFIWLLLALVAISTI